MCVLCPGCSSLGGGGRELLYVVSLVAITMFGIHNVFMLVALTLFNIIINCIYYLIVMFM